jgi:hypothetical protein
MGKSVLKALATTVKVLAKVDLWFRRQVTSLYKGFFELQK